MKEQIEELSLVSRNLVTALKAKESYEGFMNLLTQLYPDNAHFIYELLQNAEDAKGKKLIFDLYQNKLIFKHDGEKIFEYKHIQSITAIGNSTKIDDPTNIGKFGVGFKAVFAYTETPQIHSGKIKFQISELVIPELLEYDEKSNFKDTVFTFPFNNPKKDAKTAFNEVLKGLEELTSSSLLFLESIQSITILKEGELFKHLEKTHIDENFTHIKLNDQSEDWLQFNKTVSLQEKQLRVSVAFCYDNGKKRVIPIDGRVNIYFPCEKETSLLKFHIHAPFASTVARDSVRSTKENQVLINAIAELAAESLVGIRNRGLLTLSFLKVLPNQQDNIPAFYKVVENSIKEKFKKDDLIPMQNGSFASANGIFTGQENIKSIVNDKDLAELLNCDDSSNYDPPMWVANYNAESKSSSRINFFLEDLEIETFDCYKFLKFISENENCYKFFDNKQDANWFKKVYAILSKENLVYKGRTTQYLFWGNDDNNKVAAVDLPIVKLKNGGYDIGENCFFPTNSYSGINDFSFVDEQTYTACSEDSREVGYCEAAKKFLQSLGVKEVDEKVVIEKILENRYQNKYLDHKLKDILNFISVFKKNSSAINFKSYLIFKTENNTWSNGNGVYIDEPYGLTGLNEYYALIGKQAKRLAVNKEYAQLDGLNQSDFIKFLVACGATNKLRLERISCTRRADFYTYERIGNETDIDFTIEGLDIVITKKNERISKLIWTKLNETDESKLIHHNHLEAYYQANNSARIIRGNSTLVLILKNNAWIPQIETENNKLSFVIPKNASFNLLPKDFAIIKDKKWLEAVEFGKALEQKKQEQAKSEAEHKKEENIVKELGFKNKDEAKKLAELNKELKEKGFTIESIKEKLLPKTQIQTEFPKKFLNNPTRAQQKTVQKIETANAIKYKNVVISKRITADTIDPKSLLKEYYTNSDSKMVCQLCHDEMPFRTKTKAYYFEAVEIVKAEFLNIEFEAHYLALCPVCAARYKEYIKTDDEKMKKLIDEIINHNNEEITVQLDKEFKLKFVETHISQLKISLKSQK